MFVWLRDYELHFDFIVGEMIRKLFKNWAKPNQKTTAEKKEKQVFACKEEGR